MNKPNPCEYHHQGNCPVSVCTHPPQQCALYQRVTYYNQHHSFSITPIEMFACMAYRGEVSDIQIVAVLHSKGIEEVVEAKNV